MNKKQEKKCETRRRKIENTKIKNWLERFMKFLEVKVHYHEIEVHHMSSRFRRFMKLVEHFDNIGWKAHELCQIVLLVWVLFGVTWYYNFLSTLSFLPSTIYHVL